LLRWEVIFDLASKRERFSEIEVEMSDPNFWNDNEKAQKVSRQRSSLESLFSQTDNIQGLVDDLETLLEFYEETKEKDLLDEFNLKILQAEKLVNSIELTKMLSGKHDQDNAILEVNSGAGGTEAQDWGEMLLRMYLRWAENKGFKAEVVDCSPGEVCGIKSVSVYIEGENAFGYLRSERGVHRLVRISPFDQNARRHTSFASVAVMPDVETDVEIEVKEDEIRVDTYRASGAGGQHVNKTDSAVRITHIPTGLVGASQSSRSQHQNRDNAMKLLKAKLYEQEMLKKQEELESIAGERKKIDFGSQIRSYVMQPYQMVKDLRTSSETGNVDAVLNGDIDQFIEAYLMSEEHNIG